LRYDFNAPRLYIDAPLAAQAVIDLSREQINYLANVLRLREGDDVLIFNGREGEWRAGIEGGRKHLTLRAHSQQRAQDSLPDVHYLFAPLKHARLDYIVQKAVEMGASALVPVITRRTQVSRVNPQRMKANAIEAAEQCGLLALPAIADVCGFEQVMAQWDDNRSLIFCDEDAPLSDPCAALMAHKAQHPTAAPALAVIIGPEGGFDEHERQLMLSRPNVIRLSLGPRILRADTAGVAALALIQAVLGDWHSPKA
jgi:16S rRNA (uracil1498-N3)-methyltransferase